MRSYLMTTIAGLFLILIISNTMKLDAGEIPADQLQAHQHAVATIENQGGVYNPDYPSQLEKPLSHLDLRKWEGSNYSVVSDLHALDSIYLSDMNGEALEAINLPNLRFVKMFGGTFSDDNFINFIEKTPKLETLALVSTTKITDEGLACLEDLEHFWYLQIMNANMTDEGIKHLPQGLRMLNVVNCDITRKCLQTLSKRPHLEAIRLATLEGIQDSDVENLVELKKLWNLDIRKANLTNDGLRHLGKLKSLRLLNVGGAKITNKGVEEALQGLTKLTRARFHNTSCSQAGLNRLHETFWGEEATRRHVRLQAVRTKPTRRRRR